MEVQDRRPPCGNRRVGIDFSNQATEVSSPGRLAFPLTTVLHSVVLDVLSATAGSLGVHFFEP